MESDFYLIHKTETSLQTDFKFLHFDKDSSPIQSKVVLVTLNQENIEFLLSLGKHTFTNCIFIYLKDKALTTDLNRWTPVFNNFSPENVLEQSKLSNDDLVRAIHSLRKKEHKKSLQKLVRENQKDIHQQKLKSLSTLKEKEKRLLRNKKRIEHAHLNEKLNLNCLEAIFNSKSVGEIEDEITQILREPFKIDWVRILVSPSDMLTELPTIKYQNQFETKVFDLDYDSKIQGKVVFASQKGRYIKESVVPLLQKISDALSLRLKQIATENEIEQSNLQWESTFKALPFKAALINKNFKVLEYGGQFKNQSEQFESLESSSTLCYEKFFNKSAPCEGCKLGENYLIEHHNESLEVNSKEIFDPINDEHYYLNFYRDFEVSTLGESGKTTKTKLEELGIISGSIAHELNNPLGGIKILIELLKEDPELSSLEDSKDLDILMKSTDKCISIVSELLNFTRAKRSNSPHESRSLADYFQQLKVFTQAHLLSEGFILDIIPGAYLEQKILSPDSTLSIKLLEAVAHLSKKLNKLNLSKTQTIYLNGSLDESALLSITLSSKKPSQPSTKTSLPSPQPANDRLAPIAITPAESSFEEFTSSNQEQTLTLKFSTEVKLNGTHV